MKFKNNHKKLNSINNVILKYLLLFSALLIILVEVICFIIVGNTAKSTAKEKLIRVGREVAAVLLINESSVEEFIHNYREQGVIVYVLSPGGEILFPSNENSWNGDIEDVIGRLDNAGRPSASVIFEKNNTLNYISSVRYNDGSYLIASYSLSVFNGSMRILFTYFLIIGLIIIFLNAMVAYGISQRLTGGLKNLSSTAVRFAKGDFEVNFANAEYKELADLCDSLNTVRDEVKKSGDFQRELVANVSHDFKTPLTMIKAYASLIREISGDDPEKRDKHLQVIIEETDRLTGLVDDVLNVSKISSNLDELNLKVFNLTEFLYGIINKFSYLQETQGYSFMVDVDPNLYTCADANKIKQVIYNLLGNAINYTGEDKTVYISLKTNADGDRIKLIIRDTGNGISKEDLPDIWDRYYRAKENHSRPVKGTGLGLSIVKLILQSHSLDFGVESEIGKGSSFWVDFPAVSEEIEEIQ